MPTTALGGWRLCCGPQSATHPTHAPTVVRPCHASPTPHACCPPLSYVCRLRGKGGKGVPPPNLCPLLPWVGVFVVERLLPTGLESPATKFPPWCMPAMRPRPQPHAVHHSPICIDCGAPVEQGCYLPACAHFGPGCVGEDCAAGDPPSHPLTLSPWYVPVMRPRPRPHAVRHSPMCTDCGARAGQECYLPACAHFDLACVWVRTVLPETHPATHSRSHRGMCLPCIPDPAHTRSATLLCM